MDLEDIERIEGRIKFVMLLFVVFCAGGGAALLAEFIGRHL